MNLGSRGNYEVARLSDAKIGAALAEVQHANLNAVLPLSYNLAEWEITPMTVENTTAYVQEGWDHLDFERFLNDANLQRLKREYDVVAFFWPRENRLGVDPFGCCGAVGGGYLISIPSSWIDLNWDRRSVREVWLHEWLHVVEGTYGDRGYWMGQDGLHGAEEHGYTDSGGTWIPWYRDFMRQQAREGSTFVGVPPAAWLFGTRVSP